MANNTFDPTTITATTPQYFFLGSDVDGNGTNNKAYQAGYAGITDMPPKVQTWTNKGGSAGNLTGSSGSTANRNPYLRKDVGPFPIDRVSVSYDGYYNYHTALSSTTVMRQWHSTAAQGELFLLFRLHARDTTARIMGNGEGGTTNLFELYTTSNALRFEVRSTAGLCLQLNSPAIKRGNLYLYNVHHNGNAFKCSLNGGQSENSTTRSNSVTAADAGRDFFVGATNQGGSPIVTCVDVLMFWCASTELTSGERLGFYTQCQSIYPELN